MKKLILLLTLASVSISSAFAATLYEVGRSGSQGGSNLTSIVPSDTNNDTIANIRVYYSNTGSKGSLNGIRVTYRTEGGYNYERSFGKLSGSSNSFSMSPDQKITSVQGKAGELVDNIKFISNYAESPSFGGSGNGNSLDYKYVVPDDYEIIGFHANGGNKIDAIGFYYKKSSN